ncbi:MAG TPA: asparagine synthase (glutamine-hydrolyzing) [Marinilabiliales bacterium]|nr:asparagine synthase (glutamine-hydrolyzing) [Marinilabiliales bacterium]
MCGIAGFYSKKHSITADELKEMTRMLSHRGPDAEGFYFQNHVGLGHRRLSIIDLSEQANQPMTSHSGDSVIVFNGEIYNFKEIAHELGIHPKTSSDTEIILEAFEKWGPEFVHKLNGMFALAIYKKSDDSLYLFRDRLGIKPLFYLSLDNQFAFASELKSLTKLDIFKSHKAINQEAVETFLQLGYIPAPETIYQQVFKFPQGHYGIFNSGLLELVSYWNVAEQVKPEPFTDFHEAKEQLRELVFSSVKYRLISDVPYGTFLSGGIDSSLVTAVAQQISAQPLKTFSIGFAESKFDESVYARQVSEHLQTDHHSFKLTEKEAMGMVPELARYYDEPYADSSAIPTMLVSKMAREYVTMTLSGDGGDELFHGYGMYPWAERLNNPLIKNSRHLTKVLLNLGNPKLQRAAKLFDFASETPFKSHVFSQEQYFFSQKEARHLLLQKTQQKILVDEHPRTSRELTPAEGQSLFDLMYYLPDDLLVKVDRATMRYSLEDRVPLLDYRIVSFALNLHPHLKTHQGGQKFLLKELLYDYVPRELFNRPKWGFSIPLNKWLKGELSYLIDQYLSEKVLNEAGFVDPQQVNELISRYRNTNKEFLYNRIWVLICLHQWYLEVYKNN